jgi:hypothetical protein
MALLALGAVTYLGLDITALNAAESLIGLGRLRGHFLLSAIAGLSVGVIAFCVNGLFG